VCNGPSKYRNPL